MVITKYFKEGSFQTKESFLGKKKRERTSELSVKSKLSKSEKNLRVIVVRVIDHLSEEQLKELNVKRQEQSPEKKVRHEKVDWKYIKRINRDMYQGREGHKKHYISLFYLIPMDNSHLRRSPLIIIK
jgi:hypothetical protein